MCSDIPPEMQTKCLSVKGQFPMELNEQVSDWARAPVMWKV